MPIPWDGSLSVGHANIDADHEHLIAIYNRLEEAVRSGQACEIINQIFVELAEYTMSHFAREERVMIRHRFDGYEAHKAAHDALLQELSGLIGRSQTERGMAVDETLSFLRHWVTDHIMSCDQALAAFLRDAEYQEPFPMARQSRKQAVP